PRRLAWAAMAPLWLRDNGPGRTLIERATEVARARAAVGALPYLLCHLAIDDAATERWSEAEAGFHEAIALTRESGLRTDRSAALARLAWLEARQGRPARCREHAQEAIALADELGLRLCLIWALGALGDLHLGAGELTEAAGFLGRRADALSEAGIGDVDLSPAPELVEVRLRLGDDGAARRLAVEHAAAARAKGQPWALARAARALGLVADDDAFAGAFEEALSAHQETPDVFERARTELAYGSRLRRGRQRARAREQLRAALEAFDRLGAAPWSAAATAELAATGERSRRRDPSSRYELTPQELQVAVLLAGGRTTREAAGALFVSPKTVEYHLRSVYRKLGCANRDELAAAMAPAGPAAGTEPPAGG
ncbi:MAG TPA: helix-turn-helix transcriptional regulator, partial [Acidimicrobiales bacterium]|nr:helix-turn-helix transcriptional regulator [Acidimicrobiales bacterium]